MLFRYCVKIRAEGRQFGPFVFRTWMACFRSTGRQMPMTPTLYWKVVCISSSLPRMDILRLLRSRKAPSKVTPRPRSQNSQILDSGPHSWIYPSWFIIYPNQATNFKRPKHSKLKTKVKKREKLEYGQWSTNELVTKVKSCGTGLAKQTKRR